MNYKKQTGAGLIEILISLLIISVGLLGVASLQFIGSFNNTQSISRTQAELVARQVTESLRAAAQVSDISDGMVVDDSYFDSDNYNFSTLSCDSGSNPYTCYCLALPADIPNCRSDECSTSEMAQFDGWSASCGAVQVNPKMLIEVSCSDNLATDSLACSGGSAIEIKLTWPLATRSQGEQSVNTVCSSGSDQLACLIKDITL